MARQVDLSNIPEPIAKIYWQAFASFENAEDPKVKRALVGVMREVEKEATSRVVKTA